MCMCLLSPIFAAKKKVEEKASFLDKKQKVRIEDLAPQFQAWLNMVTYIANREERRVFLNLSNDRDREVFIKMFWLQRDPTPGTPANEFQDEIKKRFDYVNQYFKRGSSKPGWMTDMGRVYMALGKPLSISRFDNVQTLYPAQVWNYLGDKALGQPTAFNMTFYQPHGMTEWKLYNPAVDGPYSFIISQDPVNQQDYSTAYTKIHEAAPELADPAMSILPNPANTGLGPSPNNIILQAKILESPLRNINIAYATNFLNYKGLVNVDSSINFIESTSAISVTRNDISGTNLVTISVKPKKISVGYNEDKDQYYFNFKLAVSLKRDENIIYQYTKNFDFYVNPSDIDSYQGSGLVIHDAFPVIPGKFMLTVYLENSVGKEFSYLEKGIEVPAAAGMPYLATPVLAYKSEQRVDAFTYPYKVLNSKLWVDTERIFANGENPLLLIGVYNVDEKLWENGRIELTVKGLSERNPFSVSEQIPLKDQPFHPNMNIVRPLLREALRTDYYELSLRLMNALGIVVHTQGTDFSISPLARVPRPRESFMQSAAAITSMDYALAVQYQNSGQLDQAENLLEKIAAAKPEFSEATVTLLEVLARTKRYERMLNAVEVLKDNTKFAFEYRFYRGLAYFGQEKFLAALDELLKANEIYNSDTRVLNALGYTFLKLNDVVQAQKAFAASLKLNPKQAAIQKVLEASQPKPSK